MERLEPDTRQNLGCGYLPRTNVPLFAPLDCAADVTVCPGYSTNLPEVIEVARGRVHWSKGSLRDFCAGQPSDAMLFGVEVLEGASNECESWCLKNRSKGGE